MLAYISDANILIDMEVGGLIPTMLSLGYQFCLPDVLYWEELAEQEKCPLLTGDVALRSAAEAEHIEVKGTMWLVTEMLRQQCINHTKARGAFDRMRQGGRRLPWDLVQRSF